MNYYDARQRHTDGRWDYTSHNRRTGTHPVGYCAPSIACECYGLSPEHGYRHEADPTCEKCGGSGRIANPGHCGGHDTEQAARECFARYLLDGWREESYSGWDGGWAGCEFEGCDKPTKSGLTTRPPLGDGFPLCDEHRTFEHLKQLAPGSAGWIAASW